MMQHVKGANKRPCSRPSTPPTCTNSRTLCDESLPLWSNQFHAVWRLDSEGFYFKKSRHMMQQKKYMCFFMFSFFKIFCYSYSEILYINEIVIPFQTESQPFHVFWFSQGACLLSIYEMYFLHVWFQTLT